VPDLTVWLYPTALGVDVGELRLKRLVEQEALTVHDAAAVIWMPEAEKPSVRKLRHGTAKAAGKGSVLGGLVGLVVLGPVAGAAAGAAAGAVAHRLRSAGISDDVVDRIREQVRPGTSALLVLSTNADAAKLRPMLAHREATLLYAELSDDATSVLQELLEES
jgi:uncharacterized membrane protein